MKRGKLVLALLFSVIICSFSMIPVSAAELTSKNTNQIYHINSTTSIPGPLPGAVKSGKAKRFSTHTNLSTASSVLNFLAACLDVNPKIIAGTNLVSNLLQNNTHNQYYTRQLYYSKDHTMFYYKYNFYKRSNYTGYIGSCYSYVYSLLY